MLFKKTFFTIDFSSTSMDKFRKSDVVSFKSSLSNIPLSSITTLSS